jgi:dTDP-4-amino-4,6-dideoxyglucose formyltransferase
MNIIYLSNNTQLDDLFNWIKSQSDINAEYYSEKIKLVDFELFKPDLIISYGYQYIIREDIIARYSEKIINLHISYLPYNRGADPNLWSIIDNTPKGVTIHLIDSGVDTGHILFQKEILFEEADHTLASTYTLLQNEIQSLFKDNWDTIRISDFKPREQVLVGTTHYKKDFLAIKESLLGNDGWDVPLAKLKFNYMQLKG